MKASSLVPRTGGRSSTLALLRAIKQVAIATSNMFYLAFSLYISFIWIVVWMTFFPVTHHCYLASRISPISSGINEKNKKPKQNKGCKKLNVILLLPKFLSNLNDYFRCVTLLWVCFKRASTWYIQISTSSFMSPTSLGTISERPSLSTGT